MSTTDAESAKSTDRPKKSDDLYVSVAKWFVLILNGLLLVVFACSALIVLLSFLVGVFIRYSFFAASCFVGVYAAYVEAMIPLIVHLVFTLIELVYAFDSGVKQREEGEGRSAEEYGFILVRIMDIAATCYMMYGLKQSSGKDKTNTATLRSNDED